MPYVPSRFVIGGVVPGAVQYLLTIVRKNKSKNEEENVESNTDFIHFDYVD